MTIADHSNRRNRLIKAAARLFREKGYERTTVRDIADAVDIRSGSLFYHFKTKEVLLVAVMEAGLTTTTEAVKSALSNCQTPQEKLLALFTAHLSTLLGEMRDGLVVLLYEMNSVSKPHRARLVQLRDQYEKIWQQVLTEAIQAGLLDGQAEYLRQYLLGAVNWTVQWYNPNGQLAPADIAEQLLQMVIRDTQVNPTLKRSAIQ